MTAKECRNNCGQIIEWNNEERYFVEVSTGKRHMCPNFRKSTSDFNKNKQMYAQPKVDLVGKIAELETEIAAIKADNMELHRTLANLTVAIAKMSFKKGTDLQTTDVVEE